MEIVFYIGIVLFILFGPWIFLWRVNSRRKRERLEDQSRWSDLTARLYAVERELKQLRSQGTSAAHAAINKPAAPEPTPAKPPIAEPSSAPVPPKAVAFPVVSVPPPL